MTIGAILLGFVVFFVLRWLHNCIVENQRENQLGFPRKTPGAIRREPADIDGHWGF